MSSGHRLSVRLKYTMSQSLYFKPYTLSGAVGVQVGYSLKNSPVLTVTYG